jgi:filamentous hemagglutinin family protein
MLSVFPCQQISDAFPFDSRGGIGLLQQVRHTISTLYPSFKVTNTFCGCSILPALSLRAELYSLPPIFFERSKLWIDTLPTYLPLFFQKITETQFKQFKQFKQIQKSLALMHHKEEKILCQVCQHQITSHENKIEVNGQHEHVLSNPCGIVFEMACFSGAAGCVNDGSSTLEHTWFTDYSWRFAFCANCLSHLGWFFQSESDGFYGLILKKLDFGGQ